MMPYLAALDYRNSFYHCQLAFVAQTSKLFFPFLKKRRKQQEVRRESSETALKGTAAQPVTTMISLIAFKT
jgi:hypothetical protein